MSEPWCCPFCVLVVDERDPRAVLARRLFETHLDVHMARGDVLVPLTLLRAS